MIRFGKKSWHRRTVTWGLGRSYLEDQHWNKDKGEYGWKEKHHISICPYMRALVAVFLVSPWIAFWKILPEYCTYDHADESKGILIIGSICAIIHVIATQLGAEWWHVPVWVAAISAIIIGIMGIIYLGIVLKERWDDRPEKEHKSSLFKEYIKAKHDKVCPQVKFVD